MNVAMRVQNLSKADETRGRDGKQHNMEGLIDCNGKPPFGVAFHGDPEGSHKPTNEMLAVEKDVKNGECGDHRVDRCVGESHFEPEKKGNDYVIDNDVSEKRPQVVCLVERLPLGLEKPVADYMTNKKNLKHCHLFLPDLDPDGTE